MLSSRALEALAAYTAQRKPGKPITPEEREHAVQKELQRIWREREASEAASEPSLAQIPRFCHKRRLEPPPAPKAQFSPPQMERRPSDPGSSSETALDESTSSLRQLLLGKATADVEAQAQRLARQRLHTHMHSLVLEASELDLVWEVLREHESASRGGAEQRINFEDFCKVAERVAASATDSYFRPSHFAQFPLDGFGRISVLHFFQWARCKNSILRTRLELSHYDTRGDGTLRERDLEQWIIELMPTLASLRHVRKEFVPFYRVTAARKFLFFLDPRRRGRVEIKQLLCSPILHELLDLRRPKIPLEELRRNWFSIDYAEWLYAEYLELDTDQNGMLTLSELMRYRGGGLTLEFAQRIFQECYTYRNKETHQSEIDYKSYLDFVLATTYTSTPEAIGYFFRLLDLKAAKRLASFEICYFFRAVICKCLELGEEPNCTVADVQDEIFDMVKPRNPLCITLADLLDCKVGNTVIGMLTDVNAFFAYDRREMTMDHDSDEQEL